MHFSPEMPEEKVADLLVEERSFEKETCQLIVQVRLILKRLHKLQQELTQVVRGQQFVQPPANFQNRPLLTFVF